MQISAQWCADYSRAAGEQLHGTAKQIDLWFLIEHRGRWEPEVKTVLPEVTRGFFAGLRSSFPNNRIAFIRQAGRNSGPLAVFAAFSKESGSELYRFAIDRLEDLATLDFKTFRSLQSPVDQKLFAVCTHGTHDRCCAKYGTMVYQELKRLEGGDVWQVSHVGGCRFAPNLVCLPHGIVYGRLKETDCASATASYKAGLVDLEHLRGRSCYEKQVQAAEYFVRSAHGLVGLDALALADSSAIGDDRWRVKFRSRHTGEVFEIVLRSLEAGESTYKSCAAEEPSARSRYEVLTD